MITKPDKNKTRKKRHARVRSKITGTETRPRLNVFRSNKNIYAQLIDDMNGVTLVSASSQDKDFNLDSSATTDCSSKSWRTSCETCSRKRIKICSI